MYENDLDTSLKRTGGKNSGLFRGSLSGVGREKVKKEHLMAQEIFSLSRRRVKMNEEATLDQLIQDKR